MSHVTIVQSNNCYIPLTKNLKISSFSDPKNQFSQSSKNYSSKTSNNFTITSQNITVNGNSAINNNNNNINPNERKCSIVIPDENLNSIIISLKPKLRVVDVIDLVADKLSIERDKNLFGLCFDGLHQKEVRAGWGNFFLLTQIYLLIVDNDAENFFIAYLQSTSCSKSNPASNPEAPIPAVGKSHHSSTSPSSHSHKPKTKHKVSRRSISKTSPKHEIHNF